MLGEPVSITVTGGGVEPIGINLRRQNGEIAETALGLGARLLQDGPERAEAVYRSKARLISRRAVMTGFFRLGFYNHHALDLGFDGLNTHAHSPGFRCFQQREPKLPQLVSVIVEASLGARVGAGALRLAF